MAVMIMLSLLSGTGARAQSTEYEEGLESFREFREKRDSALVEVDEALRSLEEEKGKLEKLVSEQNISIEEAEGQLGELLNKYGAIVGNLEEASALKEEIISEYRLYRHQQRAKMFLPALVGMLAFFYSSGDKGNDAVINAFAGYGAAHLLEDTGLGLGKPLGKLTFKLFVW